MDPRARIDSVELRVADLERSRRFYSEALGLEPTGDEPGTLGAHGHTLVTLREADPGTPAPPTSTGLFHVAYRHPSRRGLGSALRRLVATGARLTGASDHGVSEALYLNDPDWNGVEVYWDRPRETWPMNPDGSVAMFTAPLDLEPLLTATDAVEPVEPGTDIGHVHLRVSDVERSVGFYRDALGMALRARMGNEAGFLAAGDYHHHVGVNSWQSRGGGPPPPGSAGLESFTIALPSDEAVAEVAERVGGTEPSDPDGVRMRLIAQ
jgi:catechol 2,3-dioxygenase